MTPVQLLTDAFERIAQGGAQVLDGLDEAALTGRPSDGANTIAWLLWHLARVQDDHVAEVAGIEQVWTAQGYAGRFGLPFDAADTGYGHSADDVAAVRVGAADLAAYLRATHEQTAGFLGGLSDADLDRIVDERWDPPVTLGARLVSVLGDDWQHIGQASYARGQLT